MLTQKQTVYAIPGWGFQSSIFDALSNESFQIVGLDYKHLSQLSLIGIAQYLSSSLDKQSVILGWSFGGLIAIQLAALLGTNVKKLILLNTQPKLNAATDWRGINKDTAYDFKNGLIQNYNKQMKRFIHLVTHPNGSLRLKHTLKSNLLFKAEGENKALLNQLFQTDLRDEYRNLGAEVLHLISDQDAIIPHNQAQLIKLNPHAHILTIPGMGHAGFLTNPVAYIDAIRDFLDDN
jgi:pimeloyl-[acyl-carrier protein] methyl ester esterase